MKNILRTSLFCLLLAALFLYCSACVLPPTADSILPENELSIVTYTKRGGEYATSGRMDLAELNLRLALKFAPAVPDINNNLGYVLLSQGRLSEARLYIQKALRAMPESLTARANFARVLYLQGELEASRDNYEKLLDFYYSYWNEGIGKGGMKFTSHDLTVAIRDLSTVYIELGNAGEAFCYSEFASLLGDASYTSLQHERFLIANERADLALNVIQEQLKQDGANSSYLFDYGIALYLMDSYQLSKQTFLRIAAYSQVDPTIRYMSLLMRLLLAEKINDDKEKSMVLDSVSQLSKEVRCLDPTTEYQYIPQGLRSQLSGLVVSLCKRL